MLEDDLRFWPCAVFDQLGHRLAGHLCECSHHRVSGFPPKTDDVGAGERGPPERSNGQDTARQLVLDAAAWEDGATHPAPDHRLDQRCAGHLKDRCQHYTGLLRGTIEPTANPMVPCWQNERVAA